MGPTRNFTIEQIKEKRVEIDALIQFMEAEQNIGSYDIENKNEMLYSMAAYQVLVHLIESKMWLGKMLEGRGTTLPAEFADKSSQ